MTNLNQVLKAAITVQQMNMLGPSPTGATQLNLTYILEQLARTTAEIIHTAASERDRMRLGARFDTAMIDAVGELEKRRRNNAY